MLKEIKEKLKVDTGNSIEQCFWLLDRIENSHKKMDKIHMALYSHFYVSYCYDLPPSSRNMLLDLAKERAMVLLKKENNLEKQIAIKLWIRILDKHKN